jgi:hypothetical protein
MLTKNWRSVQVQTPSAGIMPLPRLYGNGFFISAVYGTEAWVINKKTFESQPMHIIGDIPDAMCKGMISYNEKQYKRFLAKQQRLMSHLSERQRQSQF